MRIEMEFQGIDELVKALEQCADRERDSRSEQEHRHQGTTNHSKRDVEQDAKIKKSKPVRSRIRVKVTPVRSCSRCDSA